MMVWRVEIIQFIVYQNSKMRDTMAYKLIIGNVRLIKTQRKKDGELFLLLI